MRHRGFRRLALFVGLLGMGYFGMAALPALGAETPVPIIQAYPPVESPGPQVADPPVAASQAASEVAEPTSAATLDRPVALPDER